MKIKTIALVFALILALTLATIPVQAGTNPEPDLMLDQVDLYFGQGTTVTLTNVHRHYFRFGYRMGIYATPSSTITFHSINTPYWHLTGSRLLRGVPYNLHEFSEAIGGVAVDFNMGWCSTTGTHVFPDYMELVGGVYPWAVQLMFFMHTTFEAHQAAMHYYGYSSLLMHVLPVNPPEHYAPPAEWNSAAIIPRITVRPPDLAEGDNLDVTLTNAFDIVDHADITMQSARIFYVAPNGSVSFNRDMNLTLVKPDHSYDAVFPTMHLPAGEVFYVYGHSSIVFHWVQYPVLCCHFDYAPGVYGDRSFSITVRELGDAPWDHGVGEWRLTYHNVAARVLRFVIGSTNFTDSGIPGVLDAAPFITNERTMVPLRVIVEALGATDLDFTDGVVSFVLMGYTISMAINEPIRDMGAPVIIAERTFVPLAFVMQEIGAHARWDSGARAAYVYID